jgi:hypothetical protein
MHCCNQNFIDSSKTDTAWNSLEKAEICCLTDYIMPVPVVVRSKA